MAEREIRRSLMHDPAAGNRSLEEAEYLTLFRWHFARYPKTYSAKAIRPDRSAHCSDEDEPPLLSFPIDGDMNKDAWQGAEWSDAFVDITGCADLAPPVDCQTRFKILYDRHFVYVLTHMVSTNRELVATFTVRNSPIFQKDCDIEIFFDPSGSCHSYKEFEGNALNTVWNLLLDKPYADGGREFSGRVTTPMNNSAGTDWWDSPMQTSTVRILDGELNRPCPRVEWCLEVAYPVDDLLYGQREGSPAETGVGLGPGFWRMNLSRVEEQGNINWVWNPMVTWDAKERLYKGVVDMHRPDAWGLVRFEAQGGENVPDMDLSFPMRSLAMLVYYSQRAYYDEHGRYAERVEDLLQFLPSEWPDGSCTAGMELSLARPDHEHFTATIKSLYSVKCAATGQVLRPTCTVTQDRFMSVRAS